MFIFLLLLAFIGGYVVNEYTVLPPFSFLEYLGIIGLAALVSMLVVWVILKLVA